MTTDLPRPPRLSTERLVLRPFCEGDLDPLFALQSDAEALRYFDSPPWSERAQLDRFVARTAAMKASGEGIRVAVEGPGAQFIGWCTIAHVVRQHRSASIGYCFTVSSWGHGYGTEAAGALLAWAFGAYDLNRVQAQVDTRNGASSRVLEKLGFSLEGRAREDCIVNGEISDTFVYGLLRREFDLATFTASEETTA